ncbi:fungal-specific transcription factor domain-containing protein [Xylaria sp. FL1777]|nr:fungal-specific transcription factor domain-containing protein [Xylaria sp. FL1777]
MTSTRQQPGYACEECRRRKSRCDRVRPQCGFCVENGSACIIASNRPARGPKRGQLKALRSRIATLERELGERTSNIEPSDISVNHDFSALDPVLFEDITILDPNRADIEESTRAFESVVPDEDTMNGTQAPIMAYGTSEASLSPVISPASAVFSAYGDTTWHDGTISAFTKVSPVAPSNQPLDGLNITNLMRTDLDQLYFERFHVVGPIIHKGRYLAWANHENLSPARVCLRSAIRTVASAMSASFRSISNALYTETCRLLKNVRCTQPYGSASWAGNNKAIPLEKIQALLLLAHYELLCVDEHEAMLTAGRAFRLVQMARLYDVDKPDGLETNPEDFVVAEEKRRAFWLAFTLDRFLCSRDEFPLTLREEMTNTRLPAPETNFQQNQPIRMDFLCDTMNTSGLRNLPIFGECIVLAVLQGRCMAHRQQSVATGRALSDSEARDFWAHHELLTNTLERRTKMLEQSAQALVDCDPMVLFTHMLGHSAVIYLSGTAERAPWRTVDCRRMALACEERARRAACEVVRLAKAVPGMSCFKTHPFLPSLIASTASFLAAQTKDQKFENNIVASSESAEQLIKLLQDLEGVSNLARNLLRALKTSVTTPIVPCKVPLMETENWGSFSYS